ncbi:MAG: caspase family protein [Pseudomonadota bacterium]
MRRFFIFLSLLLAVTLAGAKAANAAETRLALVIGEAHYKVAPLATPVNDAGLIAATLKDAGFAVTEGADLDGADLRKALHDFAAKAEQAGPDAVVFIYLAGRGMQFAGQNYFVPVDALVEREADVPVVAVRLADTFDRLAAMPAKAHIFVLDGARILHFATEGSPFASGFGIEAAAPNLVYAFNEAPGAVSPDEPGPYGIYAQALVEMLRQGFAIPQAFTAARLRANDLSDGIIVPWDNAQLAEPLTLFTRSKTAPPLPPLDESASIRSLPSAKAYLAAIAADTLEAYADFSAAFPNDPLALRVRALLAARREALTWQRAVAAGTPQAIWTYMRRYPRGPHFPDARRRLAGLAAPLEPPPRFDPYDFKNLPAPSEAELESLDQPVLTFDDPAFPPPPPALALLPERPVEFEHLLPPSPGAAGLLPVPAALAVSLSKPVLPPVANPPPAAVATPAAVQPPLEPPVPAKVIGVPPLPQPAIVASTSQKKAAVPLPPKRPNKAEAASKHQKAKKSPAHPKHDEEAKLRAKHGHAHPAPEKAKPHPKKKRHT